MSNTSVNISLFQRSVLFTLNMSKFPNRRQGNIESIKTEERNDLGMLEDKKLDGKRFKLSKKLLESEELDAINEFQADLYKWCAARSVPSHFKDGLYLVRNELVPEFEAKLNESFARLRNELIPAFVETYPARVETARTALGSQFEITDYPHESEVPGKFGIKWNWVTIGVPDSLPAELRAAEAAKIEKQFEDAEQEITAALRAGFGAMLAKITDRLKVGPGEKPKIFRDSLFEDLTGFIETFNARNLVNDGELETMVEQARGLLAKVMGDDVGEKARFMRETPAVREQTAEAFAAMQAQVDSMIVNKPVRRFQFEEDEPATVADDTSEKVAEIKALRQEQAAVAQSIIETEMAAQ